MQRLIDEMTVMVACRLASLGVGLLMIPLLLHFLRGEEFAAWALYTAIGMAFSTFESASSNTLIRFVAPCAQELVPEGIARVVVNLVAILFVLYVALAPVVLLASEPLARLIHLPRTGAVSPAALVVLIYFAAMLRTLLMPGQIVMLAGGRLRWFSISSFVLSLAGTLAAVAAAATYGNAAACIVASWAVQLVVVAIYAGVSGHSLGWRIRVREIDRGVMRGILTHGVQLQLKEWALFFNSQFSKFLISAMTGLWAVGFYEVANRAVLALRSVPHSGLGLMLPVASGGQGRESEATELFRHTTRYAAFGALLFLGVPLAAGWYFMYAWAGEIGYYARWAFPALGLGTMAAVVAIPAALILQAEGRPQIEARAAVLSVALNLPVAILVIPRFGAAGAAFAVGLATAAGALYVVAVFHRLHGLQMADTVVDLWRSVRVPGVVVALAGIATTISFKLWVTPQLPVIGFSASARLMPAVIACAVGGCCAAFVLWTARGQFVTAQGVEPSPLPARTWTTYGERNLPEASRD